MVPTSEPSEDADVLSGLRSRGSSGGRAAKSVPELLDERLERRVVLARPKEVHRVRQLPVGIVLNEELDEQSLTHR